MEGLTQCEMCTLRSFRCQIPFGRSSRHRLDSGVESLGKGYTDERESTSVVQAGMIEHKQKQLVQHKPRFCHSQPACAGNAVCCMCKLLYASRQC